MMEISLAGARFAGGNTGEMSRLVLNLRTAGSVMAWFGRTGGGMKLTMTPCWVQRDSSRDSGPGSPSVPGAVMSTASWRPEMIAAVSLSSAGLQPSACAGSPSA